MDERERGLVLGALPAPTLARLRVLQGQIVALTAQRNEVVAILLEAQGYDPDRAILERLDLDAGTYALRLPADEPDADEVA